MRKLFLLGLFLLIGCSDYSVAGIEKRQQEILVYPEHINFGHLVSGLETDNNTFQVINTGDKELTIFAPVLVSGNTRFSLFTDQVTYIIGPGELLSFDVGYIPKTFESSSGFIELESDDEDEPMLVITLEGYGDAPVMSVQPEIFDYGGISIGCDNEERVTIRNDGNMDLTVESIAQMVTQPADIKMEFGSLPDPPWILNPGQEVDFLVSYVPNDIGYDESLIIVTGNDPENPELAVVQYGDGDVEKWFSQQWEQNEVPILDVLWVVDNSGSMSPHQTNLSTNVGSFMSAFVNSGADYKMAVITTDRWTFSTIIDQAHANPGGALASLVVMGTGGSANERGIAMAYESLSSSAAAGPGGIFFRTGAKLVVIFVSDEPDFSSGSWYSFIPFFDSIKPHGDFIPYGVIGDYPGGCQYQHGSMLRTVQAGIGYWDLIDYYGGNWYSICAADWGIQLQDLAEEVTSRRKFELDESDPIEATISVYVNGQLVIDWSYESSDNSVNFSEGHAPEEGQTITIDYAVWGCGS